MATARPLVFLDVETTGLDHDRHEIWEMAYAFDTGPVIHSCVPHDPRTANLEALTLSGYYRRFKLNPTSPVFEVEVREVLTGATVVAARPEFDTAMLLARWKLHRSEAPWHYRLFDIEAYAAGVMGWDELRGLSGIATALGIQQPDHTAAQDVTTLRACFWALRARVAARAAAQHTQPLAQEAQQ